MHIRRYTIAVTTAADGTATAYSQGTANGRVYQVCYVPHATTPLDTGADIVLTGNTSGVIVLDLDNIGTTAFTSAPRQATHLASTGAASLYAAGGTAVTDYVVVADEAFKLTVASGADTKSGTFYVYVG